MHLEWQSSFHYFFAFVFLKLSIKGCFYFVTTPFIYRMFCWIVSRSYHFHTSNMAPCVSVWDAECFASDVWILFPQECWYLTRPHYQLDHFDWQRHSQSTMTCFVHLLRPQSEYYSFIKWTEWWNPCIDFGYQLLEYSTLAIELLQMNAKFDSWWYHQSEQLWKP